MNGKTVKTIRKTDNRSHVYSRYFRDTNNEDMKAFTITLALMGILAGSCTAAANTTYQILLRWHIQKGFSVVPGSSNPKHIQENIEVFDFELSDAEMAKMASLNKEKRYFNMTYQQIKEWMENYEIWD